MPWFAEESPALSRDLIAFGYAGDLWTAPRSGGRATRLTTGVGVEPLPLRIYSMIHFGVTPEINAVGTLMMVMTIVIVLVALALFTYQQNARQELAAFVE